MLLPLWQQVASPWIKFVDVIEAFEAPTATGLGRFVLALPCPLIHISVRSLFSRHKDSVLFAPGFLRPLCRVVRSDADDLRRGGRGQEYRDAHGRGGGSGVVVGGSVVGGSVTATLNMMTSVNLF